MIRVKDNVIVLHTKNTTYCFRVDEAGNLQHLYYGSKISLRGDAFDALAPRISNQNGCSIIADPLLANVCLDDYPMEISSRGKGDMKEPFAEVTYADGSRTSDFRFETAYVLSEEDKPEGFPSALNDKDEAVCIVLRDRNSDLRMELVYRVFWECDCITRFARLVNEGAEPVVVNRLMSAQLDLPWGELKVTSFHGDWTREMGRYDTRLSAGKFMSDSAAGFSSNKANPFFMAANYDADETSGEVVAMNLLYSGNHREIAEIGSHGSSRLLTGINPDFFSWRLEKGEVFAAPEAVLTYSGRGYEGISRHMHDFVQEHIVRGTWKKKERPILINSWESMYFNVQEKNLLKLAAQAKKAGMELFVLDDGWFGKRNDDKSSLGDWYDNTKKLPEGLAGLSRKIKKMGLMFGIWVEPEMVSEDSDLYLAHPDWAVRIPGKDHAVGRNQMLLDLSREEVQEYIIEEMSDVFTRGDVDYVKWDMNRHISDYYSQALPIERQGEFSVRYIQGLYHVMGELNKRFPNILFEACASGGNRFDLGMLCFMPQIWASDCTDAICRGEIQEGYSYGYPQSVIGAHVSGSPNHQTLRVTPLETRFAVASAGILGYELNLADAKPEDLEEIKAQTELYKKWRRTLQFGRFYRLEKLSKTDLVRWNIVSRDKKKAVGFKVQTLCRPNFTNQRFRTRGLKEQAMYSFTNRARRFDIHRMGDLINTALPVHIKQDSLVHDVASKFYKLDGETENAKVSGSLLNHAGIVTAQSFGGTGLGEGTGLYQDFDARLYFMEEIHEKGRN